MMIVPDSNAGYACESHLARYPLVAAKLLIIIEIKPFCGLRL